MMGIDILENKVIRTRRPDDELELLKAVRDGQFMKDSVLTEEFYKVVSKYEQMYAEAERNSKLPDNPDMEAVEKYVLDINRRIINGEI